MSLNILHFFLDTWRCEHETINPASSCSITLSEFSPSWDDPKRKYRIGKMQNHVMLAMILGQPCQKAKSGFSMFPDFDILDDLRATLGCEQGLCPYPSHIHIASWLLPHDADDKLHHCIAPTTGTNKISKKVIQSKSSRNYKYITLAFLLQTSSRQAR